MLCYYLAESEESGYQDQNQFFQIEKREVVSNFFIS